MGKIPQGEKFMAKHPRKKGCIALEGFSNGGSDDLRRRLNDALNKCNTLAKLIQTELVENGQRLGHVRNLLGKWGALPDGSLLYINDYGYTTAYTSPKTPRSTRCSTVLPTIEESQAPYIHDNGNMSLMTGSMTPCGVAGRNIRNTSTGEAAWVDIKGIKHIYSSDVWKDKSGRCAIVPVEVSPEEWKAIREGGRMKKTSPCNTMDVDPELAYKYDKAQARLDIITREAIKQLEVLGGKDKELEMLLEASRRQTVEREANQTKVAGEVNRRREKGGNLTGDLDSSQLVLLSSRSQMLVWLVLMITTISLAIAALVSGPGRLGDFVLVTLALLVVYWISTIVYRVSNGY